MRSLQQIVVSRRVELRVAVWFILVVAFAFGANGGFAFSATSTATCATSAPSSNAYSVSICFTSPAVGATLTGDAVVTVTVSVSGGTSPGIQRVVFYLDGSYLLTDYQSPFTFVLPTARWVDGSHTLAAEALMRDNFLSQQATVGVVLSNGVSSPPVNTNTFQPTSGRPAGTSPFVVAATGDGASGETYAGAVSDLVASLNPNLFLYLGDVYEKGSTAEFYNWYGGPTTYFGRLRAITDPTVGNHEYVGGVAPGYFDYWDNVPSYYSFNANGWHFISLNSNWPAVAVSAASAQYTWLQNDLTSVPPQTCTIVYYHHPLFDIGAEGPTTAMSDIWKLMAQYGVDIVLNGHDHDYQRWMPLDGNGNPATNGVTEFVAGGGGHGLQNFVQTDSRVAYSNNVNPNAFGVLLLTLNSSGASFSYMSSNGSTLDSGVVPCVQPGNDTAAPSTPTNLAGSASTPTQVDLSWSASTDNVAVAGYTVYRNSVAITTVPASQLAYSDTNASAGTVYSYSVDAFDAVGNHSSQSAPITVTTPSTSGTFTFSPVADAYVNAGSPNSNYGSATTLRTDASPDVHSYLRFNVTGLGGQVISKAQLMVYANTSSSLGIRSVSVANNNWGEGTINYNNAPALGTLLSSSGAFSSKKWVTLDVTAFINAEGVYTIGLTTPGSTALSFQSREATSNRPQLVISAGVQNTPTPTATPTSTPTSTLPPPTPTATSTLAPTATPAAGPTPTPTAGGAQSQTFLPDADSYVNASYPTTNYGSSTSLRADASPDVHSYVRFTVSGVNGLPVTRARLLFHLNSSSTAGLKAQAVADNTWTEKGITYSNAPALGSVLASSGAVTSGTWVTLDVTAYVQADGTYSFGITTPGGTAISFSSRESGTNAPQLIVDWGP